MQAGRERALSPEGRAPRRHPWGHPGAPAVRLVSQQVSPQLSSIRAIVVADREIARRALADMLSGLGFVEVVSCASSAAEAQTALQDDHADLVVLASDLAPDQLAVLLGIAPRALVVGRPPADLAAQKERAADGPRLTAREAQVLAMLAEGLSNKDIARRLGISLHGAKRHVANVLMKLGCPNRAAAAARAAAFRLPV